MFADYTKSRKITLAFFRTHIEYTALIHTLGGIGLGIIIASPLTFPHPVRWALVFLGLSLLGHLYPLTLKK